MRYSVPDALWIDEDAMVSLSFDIMNTGLWDVDPCESGCALLDVMAYLSADSKWEPDQDTRISLPAYYQEGNTIIVRLLVARRAVLLIRLGFCLQFCRSVWPVHTLSAGTQKVHHGIG